MRIATPVCALARNDEVVLSWVCRFTYCKGSRCGDGVMTPPYRGGKKKENAFVSGIRDKGVQILCGTTLVPPRRAALDLALSGEPGAAYVIGALLGGDTV